MELENLSSDEAHVLLGFSSEVPDHFETALEKFLKEGCTLKEVSSSVLLLSMKDGKRSLPVFRSSFEALKEDVRSLNKALVIPALWEKFYPYLDYVEDGRCRYLFELAKKCPKMYENLLPFFEGIKRPYLLTMKCFLENNCSSRIAQLELFLHYNTVEYRIRKCCEKLNVNFSLFPTRIFLYNLLDKVKYLDDGF